MASISVAISLATCITFSSGTQGNILNFLRLSAKEENKEGRAWKQ